MSVRVVPYRTGGWEVDIRVVLPDGARRRERKKLALSSKSGARRWAEARERALLIHGPAKAKKKEVPTLDMFAPRFLDGYARANRQKPSGIAAKDTILRLHLIPPLGRKKLDAITNEDVQRLKLRLREKAPKTANNVLATLRRMLSVAVEWGVIDETACTIRQVKTSRPVMAFHDFDAYERLVTAAQAVDANTYLIVLLGGEAGLRCGEMMALEWSDVDLPARFSVLPARKVYCWVTTYWFCSKSSKSMSLMVTCSPFSPKGIDFSPVSQAANSSLALTRPSLRTPIMIARSR